MHEGKPAPASFFTHIERLGHADKAPTLVGENIEEEYFLILFPHMIFMINFSFSDIIHPKDKVYMDL